MYLIKIREPNNKTTKLLFHSIEDLMEYIKKNNVKSFSVKRLDIFATPAPAASAAEKPINLKSQLVPLSRAADDNVTF